VIETELATAPRPPATTRPLVAFLGQEDLAVPPPLPGASVQRVVHRLALELRDRFDVAIASPPHPSLRDGRHEGIEYRYVRSRRDEVVTRAAKDAVRVIRRLDLPYRPVFALPFYGTGYARLGLRALAALDPDIVHLQMSSQLLPLARRQVPRAKLVLHMHAPWLVELDRETVRARLRHADLILGVSEYISDGVRDAFPELASRCACLYNGVDVDRFQTPDALDDELRTLAAHERERLGLADGPVVMFTGSIAAEVKGYEILLEAFPRVLERAPNAKLLVASPGIIRYAGVETPQGRAARRAQRKRFRDYPRLLDRLSEPLGDKLVQIGGVPNERLPAYFALADVVAVPSTGKEALSLIALEAAACGVPVVASDRGGLPEAVLDGVTGINVPAGDAAALADAIATLCCDPALARRFGLAGRARMERDFTWRRQGDRLAGLYDALLAGEPVT
jgi:glycosyltransferase involved in cell wall biosynthesis